MSISTEGYGFLKSARWLSFLECTSLGLQLNLSIISDNGNIEFQSARTCSVCQNQFADFFPVLDLNSNGSTNIQHNIDLSIRAWT